ncbi:hypothetical protein H0H93_007499 [Arthromyces matolae]|nr:hypothetical protein H0H93_007499 [Arthromyces matolae]
MQVRVLILVIKHSASILLRKYITERWSPYFKAFKGSAPSVEIKAQIRQNVFHGLSEKDRKIRSLCAHTLSSMANSDWPDEYPELLSNLIHLISSGSHESVHGAMQVFTEFIKSDLTEDQILPVLRQLLPVLLTILGSPDAHSPLTRARTISVFGQCVTALFMVKDQYPEATKEAVSSILPVWLEAFKVLLEMDPKVDISNTNNWDGLEVRIQVFKALDTIYASFRPVLSPYLPAFLNASLAHLQALLPAFTQYYLSSSEAAPASSEDETVDLHQLIVPIIDFTSAVARGRIGDWLTTDNLNALVAVIFELVQMTDEDEEVWANNANAFVAQQDDETQSYSIRVAGFDLLGVNHSFQGQAHQLTYPQALLDHTRVKTVKSFQVVLHQVVQNAQHQREAGQEDWWRPLEAALAAVGSQSEDVTECLEEENELGQPRPIDIEYLLTNVVPSVLNLSQYPFLQGRGFVFASQFSNILPSHFSGQYLDAALQVIEAAEPGVPVKISAVKAVHNEKESWVVSSAIDLVTSLAQGSPESGLGEGFFALIAPSLFKCLGEAEDRDVLQNGIACLTVIIRKDTNQLLSWNDGNGRNGLEYTLTVIAKVLQNDSESGGLVIGDLIIHLLRRAGDSVIPVLPQLLQAMLGRMALAKTATFLQSLVIPFAFLINNQRDVVLTLLEGTYINDRSGLDILVQTWCENAETFQGFWPTRMSTLGLLQLFVSERPSLQHLIVKGDIIVNSANKDAPTEFTSITFPLKALKLLLHDVRSGGESATLSAQGGASNFDDVDSDDGDEDWTEEEKLNQGFKDDEFAFLSDMIGPRGMAFDNDDILDQSDDEDLKNDPISEMDMQAHLISFFKECAARNLSNFSTLVGQLTVEETLVLREVVGV